MENEISNIQATAPETQPIMVRKSNELIVAKQNTTLLENILVSIGISRMNVTPNGGKLVACIYPMELMKIMNLKPGDDNIYSKLKKVAKSMTSHPVVVEDGKGNFTVFPLINEATYVNGIFTIYFHENAKPMISYLTTNFTTMNLLTLSRFKSNYTFRLYEILLKEAWKIPTSPSGYVEVTYNISELRFMISVANVEEERVRRELGKYRNADEIDWDRLYDMTVVKKAEKWNNFKDRIIEKARKEMKEKADICFDAEYLRSGREGYKHIKFKIYFNNPTNPIEDYGTKERLLLNSDGHQYDVDEVNHPKLFQNYLGHNGLTSHDLKILLGEAGQNEELVMQAIKMADAQEDIYNYVGWLRSCIRRNFEGAIHVMQGSADEAKKWDDFREDLEKEWAQPGYKASLWARIQKNPDFSDFLASMHMSEAAQLETIFTPDTCVDVYFEYKRDKLGGKD